MSSGSLKQSDKPNSRAIVLVVEDDPILAEVVCTMLEMGGTMPKEALEPRKALEILSNPDNHVDLLITDLRMPGMSGMELIHQVRALRPTLKTMLYTGNADLESLANYPTQPDRFLIKPFTPAALNAAVHELLSS